MAGEELESFAFDRAATGKKPRRKKTEKPFKTSGAPAEEIDALAEISSQEEEPLTVEDAPVEEVNTEPEPVSHDFDSLPSAPAPKQQTDWERFLSLLPLDVLQALSDCGLLTLKSLLSHSAPTLQYPVGRFREVQLQQLQVVMARFGWELAKHVPPSVEKFMPSAAATNAVVADKSTAFQQQRNEAARARRISF